MKTLHGLAAVLCLAGCSSDPKTPVDAAQHVVDARAIDAGVDAPAPLPDAPTLVQVVTCPSGALPTVITNGLAYSPMTTTIAPDGIVKFTMPDIHNVVPDVTGSDPGLHVPFSTTRCLKFTAPGTFGFHCGPHQFTGSIIVN